MKSPNEELCKSRFATYLKSIETDSLAWQDGDEPPDYYLSIDDKRYATEVTILMEKRAVGNGTIPTQGIMASLWNFIDEVEKFARQENILRGTYLVAFSQPISNFRNVKDDIRDAMLEYILQTKDVENAPRQEVYKNCTIIKIHSKADRIHKTGPSNGKWEGEAAAEICEIIEERLLEKKQKLRRIQLPKIVILYDAYLFADPLMYRNCISHLSSLLASFHTVFIVHGNNQDFVLHSENPNWLLTSVA